MVRFSARTGAVTRIIPGWNLMTRRRRGLGIEPPAVGFARAKLPWRTVGRRHLHDH
jgi:hypothetical protein